ncbi:MAG: DUF2075 domain-containing protein [Oscillospiraceae bacterium]|nr:DUF2075 domain-containing protein [Oscillospiraceae bacterium]
MYTIETKNFSNNDFNTWELMFDYHCVYILENGKEAYIGESGNAIQRAKKHYRESPSNRLKKYNFKRIHIINAECSEETPAKHFEHLLIRLMRIDKKFKIVNDKEGENPIYIRRNQFEAYFDKLWIELEKKSLVNKKEFQVILNSGMYKYSPYTMLTEKQQQAVDCAVRVLDSEETHPPKDRSEKGYKERTILISGDAGTGKTLVATSLFYYLKNNSRYKDKKIALVYSNPAIRKEIQQVFKQTDGLEKKFVISPIDVTKQFYDIVICDEAHRLRQNKNLVFYKKNFENANKRLNLKSDSDELDWILKNSGRQILFYDSKQISCPCDISKDSFDGRLFDEKRGVRLVQLDEQMRIQAGEKYIPYIYSILYKKCKMQKPKMFKNYEFCLFSDFSDMVKLVREKEESVGLSRLCGGYAWKWIAKKDKSLFDIIIDGEGVKWNTKSSGWLSNQSTKNEMGSIYTLAGLDLNYAGVVIGNDLFYDKADNKIKVNKKSFYDGKVKKGVKDEDLKAFVLNTYAVLLTRAIKGTFVYVCDENLREYLQKFIPYKEESS